MAEITLYTNLKSRGRVVEWMLAELDVPYTLKDIAYGDEMKSADFLAINPMGKVPALTHGDAVVTETPAILAYLADTFADKGLIPPAGSEARAAFYRWLFFVAGPLEQATGMSFLGLTPPEKTPIGNPSKGYLGFGTLELTLKTLENHLAQNAYLCGEQFTAADIYLASSLLFGGKLVKAYPSNAVFDAYIRKTHARPAKQTVDARA